MRALRISLQDKYATGMRSWASPEAAKVRLKQRRLLPIAQEIRERSRRAFPFSGCQFDWIAAEHIALGSSRRSPARNASRHSAVRQIQSTTSQSILLNRGGTVSGECWGEPRLARLYRQTSTNSPYESMGNREIFARAIAVSIDFSVCPACFVINCKDGQLCSVKDVLEIDYAPFYYGVPVPKSELTKLLADAVIFQAFNAYFSRRDAHRRAVAVAWSAGDRDRS